MCKSEVRLVENPRSTPFPDFSACSFPWSRTSTTTSSPWWTPGIDSTPTTSLSATAIRMLLRGEWSERRSRGGGATSPSLGSHLLTGCWETYKQLFVFFCKMKEHTRRLQWWMDPRSVASLLLDTSVWQQLWHWKLKTQVNYWCFLEGWKQEPQNPSQIFCSCI